MSWRLVAKKVLFPFLKPLANLYLQRQRRFSYKNLNAVVLPGVFHPGLFISTKILLDYLDKTDLKSSSFLELGCGSGVLSVLAAYKGANVTAIDINAKALENTQQNALLNEVEIEVVDSDVLSEVLGRPFDYIVINPPYYAKKPANSKEMAWYCGENFEFFVRLFAQLQQCIHENSKVLMILSEDCDLKEINKKASDNEWLMEVLHEEKVVGEKNWIFQIRPASTNQ